MNQTNNLTTSIDKIKAMENKNSIKMTLYGTQLKKDGSSVAFFCHGVDGKKHYFHDSKSRRKAMIKTIRDSKGTSIVNHKRLVDPIKSRVIESNDVKTIEIDNDLKEIKNYYNK
jgi:hypothetical protein